MNRVFKYSNQIKGYLIGFWFLVSGFWLVMGVHSAWGQVIQPVGELEQDAGSTFWVDVEVGSITEPVSELFGVSFELTYDQNLVEYIRDEAGVFLGSSPVYASDANIAEGSVGIGVSHKQGDLTSSGFGVVARVQFRLRADAVPGRVLTFGVADVVAVDESNQLLNITPGSFTTSVREPIATGPPIRPIAQALQLPGSAFWVDIEVGSDFNPVEDLFGVSFELEYDTQYLTLIRHEAGAFLGGRVVYAGNEGPEGVLGIGVSQQSGARGQRGAGTVARALFQLAPDAPVETDLEFAVSAVTAVSPDGNSLSLEPGDLIIEVVDQLEPKLVVSPGTNAQQPVGNTFWLDITASALESRVDDFFGTSFELVYDEEQVSVIRSEQGGYWRGRATYVSNDDPATGRLGIGVTHQTSSGSIFSDAVLARVLVKMNPGVEVGDILTFGIENVIANTSTGASIGIIGESSRIEAVEAVEPSSILYSTAESPQPTGGTFWVDILAGTNEEVIRNLSGVSFEFDYDERYLRVIGHEAGPQFQSSNVVYVGNDNADQGRFGVGLSSGVGAFNFLRNTVIARVQFVLGVQAPNDADLIFNIDTIEAVLTDGASLPLGSEPLSIKVNAVPNPVPVLTSIQPDSAEQGQILDIVATGEAFFEGATTVEVEGSGIDVSDLRIDSYNQLTFTATVDPRAVPGDRTIRLMNGLPGGGISDSLRFSIIGVDPRPRPVLTNVQPRFGILGETSEVVFTGSGFVENITRVVVFGDGIDVQATRFEGDSILVATIFVDPNTRQGTRTLQLSTRAPGGGNSVAFPFEVLDAPRSDLVARRIQAPPAQFFGEFIEVAWEVENVGLGDTGSRDWFDRIYLSEDQTFNRFGDIQLGTVGNLTALTGQGTPTNAYTNSANLQIPVGTEGTFYVVLATDANNSLREDNEENNVVFSAQTIEIQAPPLPDLQVTSVVSAGNAFSSDTVRVQWTVENNGDAPADAAEWFDSIFLSDDDQLDAAFIGRGETRLRILDPYLNRASRQVPLAPGESYTASAEVVLPPRIFGEYTLFVYSDFAGSSDGADGDVFEFSNNFNNWTGIQFKSH